MYALFCDSTEQQKKKKKKKKCFMGNGRERRVRVNSGKKRRKKAVEYVRKRTLNEDKNTYNIQATCGVRINYDKVIMRVIFGDEVTHVVAS